MDQSVKMTSALLDLLSHIVIDLHVEDVCNEVKCILIVLNLGVQTGQVEAIREIVLVNLAKVLIAPG